MTRQTQYHYRPDNPHHRPRYPVGAVKAPADTGPAGIAWSRRSLTPGVFLVLAAGGFVVLFGLAWLWVLAMPMAFLDPEYPAWRAKEIMLAECDLGNTVILGDSRAAAAMMPALWRVPATNFAVGGGEPIEASAALTRALRCPDPPERVILSLDAAHFAEPDLFWERTAHFGFLDGAEIATLRRVSHDIGDQSVYELRHTDGLPSWLRDQMVRARFPSLYFSSLMKGGLFLRWRRNRQTLDATLAAHGQYFFGTASGSNIVAAEGHMHAFRPLPVLEWYFNRILQQLDARGIPAVFIAVPMNDATYRQIPPVVRTGFRAWLAGYEARFPRFRVAGEVMPHWPDAYFGDGFAHLNPEGAARFSGALGRCLEVELTAPCVQRLQDAPPNTQKDAQ